MKRSSFWLAAIVAFLLPQTAAVEPAEPGAFRFAEPHRVFSFPADHGSHPDYRIEWWYLTGHLFSGPRRFGFQATFFRFAERPGEAPPGAFSDGQYYLAHMALTDPAARRFLHEERLNREGWDAWARTGALDLRNGNWTLRRDPDAEGDRFVLAGSIRSEVGLDLTLTAEKPPAIFGSDGVSRKGAEAGAASHYITFTRLAAAGSLRIGGETREVAGQAWMDHEFSSAQLGRDQIGWDWVSIQLHDGREIMAYILRNESGQADPFSTLAWIGRSGEVSHFSPGEFGWEAEGHWQSRETGGRYPIAPRISTTDPESGKPRRFSLRPLLKEQEIPGGIGGIGYWEGACDVLDEEGREAGMAYLELTGYAGETLRERLRGD